MGLVRYSDPSVFTKYFFFSNLALLIFNTDIVFFIFHISKGFQSLLGCCGDFCIRTGYLIFCQAARALPYLMDGWGFGSKPSQRSAQHSFLYLCLFFMFSVQHSVLLPLGLDKHIQHHLHHLKGVVNLWQTGVFVKAVFQIKHRYLGS